MDNENLRPVEVQSYKKSFKGVFHGWTSRMNNDIAGQEFTCKLAIVENLENGEVSEVNPELIRFTDR